jgi:hypothetical protein
MSLSTKIFDTPQGFFNSIPKVLGENLNYRHNVLGPVLDKDKTLQKIVMQMMFVEPKICVETAMEDLFDPEPEEGEEWKQQ